MLEAIKGFFHSGKMLKELNHTFIALLQKIEQPETVNNYRPISLCNTIYKAITKILVNRLRPLLNKFIGLFQSAFVPGRAIHDNVLIAHEIMHMVNTKKIVRPWMAIKLDMEKAYDRVEWNFILQSLKDLGFDEKWNKWVEQCIKTTFFSVIVNENSVRMIKPSRGLRQGDPLSPYLFLVCMEVLSRKLMAEAVRKKSGIGFKVGKRGPIIPCLLFADDSLIFCEVDRGTTESVKRILEDFSKMTG